MRCNAKMTGIKTGLISGIDKFQLIERGIRSSVSFIVERYVKANTKYISDYDPITSSNYITYLNEMYELAMNEIYRQEALGGFLKKKLI